MPKAYKPKDKYLWDSWFVRGDDDAYHAFYLQSDMSVTPDERHDNLVSIGHAVSRDLKRWQELPTALEPGGSGQWDSLSLWTGSVIKRHDSWFMFYTGRSGADAWKQQIGCAVSKDLIVWQKLEGPVLPPNYKHYSAQAGLNSLKKPQAWRDPFVIQDPKDNKYYMCFSARAPASKTEYNGCVGLAVSDDLVKWTIKPPLIASTIFDEMETTQLIADSGKYYLLFSTYAGTTSPTSGFRPKTGLYCYVADKIDGQYKPVKGNGLVLDYKHKIYDVRLIEQTAKGRYLAVGWQNYQGKQFVGALSKVYKINLKAKTEEGLSLPIRLNTTFKKLMASLPRIREED